MSERAAYSRVYWSVVDDPKFASIFDDDRHLACWLRLLLIADQAHPASANIPHGTRRVSVLALTEAGLISIGTGSRFRIVGLDAERKRRSDAATRRPPSGGQAGAKRDPESPYTSGLRRDERETRQDEPSRDTRESHPADDGRADLEAFLLITRKAPSHRQRALLDGLLDRHDLTGPQWAADIMLRHPDDPIGAVIEADKAWRAERIAEAQAAEVPKAIPRRSRGLPQSARDILAQMAELDRERPQ